MHQTMLEVPLFHNGTCKLFQKNSYFKDENTIHVFPPKKRDFTPNRVVYNTGETCKLPTNMRCIKKITAFGRIFMFAAYM
jgi:hypothetical protein